MTKIAEEIYEGLKSKPVKEIKKAFRLYKEELGKLKERIEKTGNEDYMDTALYEQLLICREKLEGAVQAYIDTDKYYLGYSEKKVINFNDTLDSLTKIEFSVGNCFDGYRTFIITFDDTDKAHMTCYRSATCSEYGGSISKSDFIAGLKNLYIGGWKSSYMTEVLDGTRWELKLQFKDRRAKNIYGSNSYPYNFIPLKELFRNTANSITVDG